MSAMEHGQSSSRRHAARSPEPGGSTQRVTVRLQEAHVPTLISREDASASMHQRVPSGVESVNARLRFNNDRLLEDNLRLTTQNHILEERNADLHSENAKLQEFVTQQKKVNTNLQNDMKEALKLSKEARDIATSAAAKADMTKKESVADIEFYSQVLIDCQVCVTSLGGKPQFPLRHVEPWKSMCESASYEKNYETWQRLKTDATGRFLERNWKSESVQRKARSRSPRRRDRRR